MIKENNIATQADNKIAYYRKQIHPESGTSHAQKLNRLVSYIEKSQLDQGHVTCSDTKLGR